MAQFANTQKRGCNLEIPHLLMVLLTITFNKLPLNNLNIHISCHVQTQSASKDSFWSQSLYHKSNKHFSVLFRIFSRQMGLLVLNQSFLCHLQLLSQPFQYKFLVLWHESHPHSGGHQYQIDCSIK